jgi:kinesin family protein 6/9
MIGDTQHYEHRGIAPRAIAHLYSEMSARLEIDFEVRCTYVEIYNEK